MSDRCLHDTMFPDQHTLTCCLNHAQLTVFHHTAADTHNTSRCVRLVYTRRTQNCPSVAHVAPTRPHTVRDTSASTRHSTRRTDERRTLVGMCNAVRQGRRAAPIGYRSCRR